MGSGFSVSKTVEQHGVTRYHRGHRRSTVEPSTPESDFMSSVLATDEDAEYDSSSRDLNFGSNDENCDEDFENIPLEDFTPEETEKGEGEVGRNRQVENTEFTEGLRFRKISNVLDYSTRNHQFYSDCDFNDDLSSEATDLDSSPSHQCYPTEDNTSSQYNNKHVSKNQKQSVSNKPRKARLKRHFTFSSGHEQPHPIKMNHMRDAAKADGSDTPIISDRDLNDNNNLQFLLRETKKSPAKLSMGE